MNVVMFSGGVGSWAAARRTVEAHGTAETVLLFTDTLIEDPDLYRFLGEAATDVGAPLIRLADGRTPRQVFKDRRMLGNSRIAPCSTELKQKPARRWMEENAPADAIVVLGIDFTEEHRLAGAKAGWLPWAVDAPLTRPPLRFKEELLADLDARGIQRPALYREGFPHNNCGGGCVRAGAKQWAFLARRRPAVFADWVETEEEVRDHLGADVTILRSRRGGSTRPLSLRELRARVAREPNFFEEDEWGGCGCFLAEDVAL